MTLDIWIKGISETPGFFRKYSMARTVSGKGWPIPIACPYSRAHRFNWLSRERMVDSSREVSMNTFLRSGVMWSLLAVPKALEWLDVLLSTKKRSWLLIAVRASCISSWHSVNREGNPEWELYGEVLVFTGALQIPRKEAAGLAASTGCAVASGVTKETTLLVVGDQDVSKLAGKNKGS